MIHTIACYLYVRLKSGFFLLWNRIKSEKPSSIVHWSLLDSHKSCGVLMHNSKSQIMEVPKLLMNEFDFYHRLEIWVYYVIMNIYSPQKCHLLQGSWIKWHCSTQSGFPQWKSNCPFFGRPPRGVLPGSSCPGCYTDSLWIGTDLWKSHIAFRNICILNYIGLIKECCLKVRHVYLDTVLSVNLLDLLCNIYLFRMRTGGMLSC